MPTLTLKPTHKPIRAYYAALERFDRLGISPESAAPAAFQALLEHCARQCAWTLAPEQAIAPLLARGASNTARGKRRIVVDGALIDDFQLIHGIWEAKDIHDDLLSEARRKFEAGYPATTSSSRRRNAPSCGRTVGSCLTRTWATRCS